MCEKLFQKRANINKIKALVGNTPLIKIADKIYAKFECYNPSGSIKDRMVSYILRRDMLYGKINNETILCEATSGNTGISLSMLAANIGNPCVIFMPKNMSRERRLMMESYGANIIEAPEHDFDGAIALRDAFLRANENAWSPNQFSNEYNVDCHERTTAPEIHKQVIETGKRWSAIIHGAGTGGTIEGLRRYIKKNNMLTKVCMVTPEEKKHGIQGIGDGREFLASKENMDRILPVKTEDAIARSIQFSKSSGLFVGISSGANILAAERWVSDNRPTGIVVTFLCDRGER